MPAKTPIYLKTSTPKRGKKLKLRDVLSGDMISPPLGDVRHSAHVGPEGEGDMFGDVGFLQGKLDMLPGLARPRHPRSNSMDRHLDDMFDANPKGPKVPKGLNHTYDPRRNFHHSSHLKSTISMPVFIAPEQPPPKPPRLHLEETSVHEHNNHQEQHKNHQEQHKNHQEQQRNLHNHQEQHKNHHNYQEQQKNHHNHQEQQKNHHNQQQRSMSLCEEVVSHCRKPCNDLTISASIPILRHLVPSSGSFSEASSDDSISEGCGPPDPSRGLSLDSDAGLSNEDLRSDRSESPALSLSMSRSESLIGLDLDLGPSILDDVLGIMDRYKSVEDRCNL